MMRRNILLTLFMTAISAHSQPVSGGLSPEQISQMRAQYAKLNGQTFALNGNPELGRAFDDSPERVPVIREELLGLLRQAVMGVLSSPGATERQVRATIDAVQGDFALGAWGGQALTNTPFAHFFAVNGNSCFAAAFAILEGGAGIPDSQSFLDFYVKSNNEWKLQSVTGSEFRSSTFFVSPITAGLAGESWFLAWGSRIGDTGARLAIRLYSFDGNKVRVVWQRDGLSGGEAQISGSTVTLTYLKQFHDADRIQEILHVTPNGLQ